WGAFRRGWRSKAVVWAWSGRWGCGGTVCGGVGWVGWCRGARASKGAGQQRGHPGRRNDRTGN
ncbi:hypothetical protein KI387_020083, partial [Taxus chinensis]